MPTSWWRKLVGAFGFSSPRKRHPIVRKRLQLELLEDRLAPASLIFDTATSEFTSAVRNQGWWTAAGASNSHIPGNDNYYTGSLSGDVLRSFFTFDLGSLNLTGQVITSATLKINSAIISSANPTVGFWDVTTPASTLSLTSGRSSPIFIDLGSGINYGNFPVTDTQSQQLLSFPLNSSAVADITAHAGAFFSVGGAIASPGVNDFVFSGSGGTTQQLVLQVVGTLSPALDVSGNLTIADTTGAANNLTVSADAAGNLVITDANEQFSATPLGGTLSNGNKTLTIPKTSVSHLIFNTSDGTDTLTVDYGQAGGFFTTPIDFHGGNNAGDNLIVKGGAFTKATHTFTTAGPGHSGTLLYDLDGAGTTTGTINYDGLAPVNMTGSTITNLVFNLPAVASNAFLEDDGASNSISQLRSGLGVFETTTFSNPALGGSVTINGAAAVDNLTVKALPDFSRALAFGSAIDIVNLAGNLTLASFNDQAGATVVNAASVTVDTSAGNGAITFANSIDDVNAVPTNALVLKAGTGAVSLPAIGAALPLASIQSTTTGVGATTFNGNVKASAVTLSGDVTLGNSVNLTYSGFGALIINGGTLSLGVNTLTLTDSAVTDTGSISDIISGGGQLIKQGTGTLTLSAINNYTGKTTISGGKLTLSNAASNSNIANSTAIDVQTGAFLDVAGLGTGVNAGRLDLPSGQTLQGAGTLSGAVKALSGSHVAPGESPGILKVGSTTFSAGATFDVEINGTTVGTQYDQLNVTGAVTIDTTAPGVNLNLSLGYVPTAGDTYILIANNAVDAVTGTFANQPQGHIFTVSGKRFGILYDGDTGNDVVMYALAASPTFYVDDSWAALSEGTVISDADPVLAGLQTKVIGVDAFSTISNGLTALGNAGATDLYVLDGTYSEAVSLPASVTMHVVGGTVTVNSLATAFASASVDLGANTDTLVTGDATNTSFLGNFSGTGGNLTKQGLGRFTLSGTNSYTGVTTVSGGTLRVTTSLGNSTGEVDLTGTDVVLDGNSTGQVLRPVVITGASAQVTNLTVNTMSAALDGITVKPGADNVTISSVNVTGSKNGINADAVSGLQLTSDTVTANSADGVTAINLKGTTTISGGTFGTTGTGNGGHGLNLTGDNLAGTNLILSNAVIASNNTTDGLFASKFPGQGATAGVSITGGTFSNNSGDGIHLVTVGAVSTSGVTTAGNDPGIFINGALSYTDTDGDFSTNLGDGIQLIDITGLVSLTRTNLQDNGGDGLNASGVLGSLTVSGTTIKDTAALKTQKHGILTGDIGGAVTFNDNGVIANLVTGNTVGGVTLGNVSGAVSITSTHGASYSTNSGGDGIHVASLTGILTVSAITANSNGGDGLFVGDGGTTADLASSSFSGNATNGIELNVVAGSFSAGVTLTSVTASSNTAGDGVKAINLTGTTTINGGTFGNTGTGNGGDGLNLTGDNLAGTNLILSNAVIASNNATDGLFASKFPGQGATPGVSITGGTFSNNTGDGVHVNTVTKLTIDSVNAKSNVANGLEAVTLSGVNTIDNSHFELNARGILLSVGSLTTTNTTISSNKLLLAGDGAGVLVTSGSLTLDTGTAVIGNETTAGSGGGVAFESAGTLTIQSATTKIQGNKASANGGGLFINAGTTKIQNGATVAGNQATGSGGGIDIAAGMVTLDNVAIGGANILDQNKAGVNGGGINAVGGSLTLQNNVKVQGNSATSYGGGINVAGADVTFFENLLPSALFYNSTPAGVVSGNSAANGGGLNVSSGTLTMDVTTVSGNSALTGAGGGLNASAGIVKLTNSTFSGNSAFTSGGGINFSGGTDSLTNVTVSNNTANGGMAVSGAATVTLINDTFASNTGGGATQTGGTVTSANSLFASNTTGNDFNGAISINANAAKNGNNLFQRSIGASGTVASDVIDKLARLAELDFYGGPTKTHALLPGSFALDTGKVTSVTKDQRGLLRPVNGFYDIGAYESRGFTVTRSTPINEMPSIVDPKYRGLVGTDFLNDDGTTPTIFKVGVTADDVADAGNNNVGLTKLKGGIITFLATSGAAGDTASPHSASTTFLVNASSYTAQTTVQANLTASNIGSSYFLIATANPNVSPKVGTDTAPGPNNTDWLLFNQLVTTLHYSGQPQNTTQNATAVNPQPPSPIQFVPAGTSKTSFSITMLDQEDVTVKVANLPVAVQSYLGDAKTFGSTAVNNALPNAITFTSPHSFTTGQALVYDNGTGSNITGALKKSTYLFSSANVNFGLLVNTITFSENHGLVTGQALTYQNGGGAGMAGLTNSLTYYAVVVNPTTIKLALNPAAATLGTAIKLLSAGNVTQSLTPTYYAIVVNATTIRLAINQDNAKNLVPLPLLIQGSLNQSLAPTGAINTATGNGLTAANTASGAINSGATIARTAGGTLAGVAPFTNANLKIYTSSITPYRLQALYTNPNGQSVALDHGSSNPFTVLPMSLAITGGNFAGFGQKLYNIIIVQSDRGPVRLVNVTQGQNNLLTNQVKIEAFDYSLIGGKSISAIYYNGPVVLTSSVPVTPALKPFYLLSGGKVIVTLTPINVFGEFILDASTSVSGASPGVGALTVSTKASGGSGNFIRFNIGRQRGR